MAASLAFLALVTVGAFLDTPSTLAQVTTGVTSDLRQATRYARHMVAECGMSDALVCFVLPGLLVRLNV